MKSDEIDVANEPQLELFHSLNTICKSTKKKSKDVMKNPEVISLVEKFAPLTKKINDLREYRLTCKPSEYEKNSEEIDDLYSKMDEISEVLLGKFDVWISFKTGEAMPFNKKFPWYKELTNRGAND